MELSYIAEHRRTQELRTEGKRRQAFFFAILSCVHAL